MPRSRTSDPAPLGAERPARGLARGARRRIAGLVVGGLLAGCAVLPPAPVEAPAAPPAVAEPLALVIYDLEDPGEVLTSTERRQLSAFFRARVAERPGFRVVAEAEARARLTAEKRAALSAGRDADTQVALGRAVSASTALRVEVLRLGERCTTTSARYDLETETRIETASVDGDCGAGAQRDALARLAEGLGGAGPVAVEGRWRVRAQTLLGVETYGIVLVAEGAAVEGASPEARWQGRLNGRVLTGTWQRNGFAGRMKLTFTADGSAFVGVFGLGELEPGTPMEGERAPSGGP